MNRRDPIPARAKLQDSTPRQDGFKDALAKPGAVAIDPPGEAGDNRQSRDEISVQSIEGRAEAASRVTGPKRCVFGDRTRPGDSVAARIGDVNHTPRRPVGDGIQQIRIHRDAFAHQRCRVSSTPARFVQQGLRRNVKDPLGTCFVLPLAGLRQLPHDGCGPGLPHSMRRLHRRYQANHLMAARDQDLDEFRADEPGGVRDETGDPSADCHAASVSCG